jgi:hypothetical protein
MLKVDMLMFVGFSGIEIVSGFPVDSSHSRILYALIASASHKNMILGTEFSRRTASTYSKTYKITKERDFASLGT